MEDFILVGLHLKDTVSLDYTINKILELSNNGDDYSFSDDGDFSAFEYASDVYFETAGFKIFNVNSLEFKDIKIEDAFELNIEGLYLSELDRQKETVYMNLFGLSANRMEDYNVELDYYLVAPFYKNSLFVAEMSYGNTDVYFDLFLLAIRVDGFILEFYLNLLNSTCSITRIAGFMYSKDFSYKSSIYYNVLFYSTGEYPTFVSKLENGVIVLFDRVALVEQGDGNIIISNNIDFIYYKFNENKMKEPFTLVIPPSVKNIFIIYPKDKMVSNLTFIVSNNVTDEFLRQLSGTDIDIKEKSRNDVIDIIKNKIGVNIKFY